MATGRNTTEIEELANEAKTTVVNLGSLIKNLTSKAGSVISGIFDFDKGDKKEGKDSKKKKKNFIEDLLSGGAFGTLMDKISKPTEESFKDNNYKAIMKDKYFNEGIEIHFLKSCEMKYKQSRRAYVPWLSIIDVMMFNSIENINVMLNEYELE